MRWHTVVSAVRAALNADTALAAVMGGRKAEPMSSTASRTVPGIRYTVFSDVEEEVMNPVGVQVDYWASGMSQAVVIEGRIRAVLDRDARRSFGGLNMSTQFVGARDSSDPDPGVVHRQLDFLFAPVRSTYT